MKVDQGSDDQDVWCGPGDRPRQRQAVPWYHRVYPVLVTAKLLVGISLQVKV